MIKQIKYSDLKQFSKLFIDFIGNNDFVSSKFRHNIETSPNLNNISKNYTNRTFICDFLENQKFIEWNDIQISNIEKLKKENTLCVVTGQQTGLYGGPLYTVLKAHTAIGLAKKLSTTYPSFDFVPIFWVEDNDHDKDEASYANFFDAEYNLFTQNLEFEQDRSITSSQTIKNSINEKILELKEKFKHIPDIDTNLQLLENNYKEGKSWTAAFIGLMNDWLGEYGLLFVSASSLIETGIFKPLIKKEIECYFNSHNLINQASTELESAGYHVQVAASEINLFYLDNNERCKIKPQFDDSFIINQRKYSMEALLELVEKEPNKFTPKVLLRPIFQDYVIPDAVYVGGPGEIAYFAEIDQLYKLFDVEMPNLVARHSITIFDKKVSKFLEKNALHELFFLQEYSQIEKHLSSSLMDVTAELKFREIKEEVKISFDKIAELVLDIDNQLDKTITTALGKCIEQVEIIQKKTISSIKRQNSDLLNRYRMAANLIYPESTLQERYFSAAIFYLIYGKTEFNNLLEKITKFDSHSHHFISI